MLPSDASAQAFEQLDPREREQRQEQLHQRVRAQALQYALDHVVRIEATDPAQGGAVVGFGAGLLVGQTRGQIFIATANHVVRRGDGRVLSPRVTLRAYGGGTYAADVLPVFDRALDVAVIAIPAPPLEQLNLCRRQGQLLAVLSSSYSGPEPGHAVQALGHPNGRPWAGTTGGGTLQEWSLDRISFESVTLSPGHSGGALVNEDKALIGMVLRDAAPFGEAISIESLLRRVDDWGLPVTLTTQYEAGTGSPWARYRAAQLDRLMKAGDEAGLSRALQDCRLPHHLAQRRWLDMSRLWGLGPDYRRTPSLVWLSVREGRADALGQLLAAGLDPSDRDGPQQALPLHATAVYGRPALVEVLVKAGAAVDSADVDGDTPLHYAARRARPDVIRALVNAGAVTATRNKAGQTPVDLARGRVEVLQALGRTP
jgi:hypothetical protein